MLQKITNAGVEIVGLVDGHARPVVGLRIRRDGADSSEVIRLKVRDAHRLAMSLHRCAADADTRSRVIRGLAPNPNARVTGLFAQDVFEDALCRDKEDE